MIRNTKNKPFSIRMNKVTRKEIEKIREVTGQPIGVLVEAAMQHTYGIAPHRNTILGVLTKLKLVIKHKE